LFKGEIIYLKHNLLPPLKNFLEKKDVRRRCGDQIGRRVLRRLRLRLALWGAQIWDPQRVPFCSRQRQGGSFLLVRSGAEWDSYLLQIGVSRIPIRQGCHRRNKKIGRRRTGREDWQQSEPRMLHLVTRNSLMRNRASADSTRWTLIQSPHRFYDDEFTNRDRVCRIPSDVLNIDVGIVSSSPWNSCFARGPNSIKICTCLAIESKTMSLERLICVTCLNVWVCVN